MGCFEEKKSKFMVRKVRERGKLGFSNFHILKHHPIKVIDISKEINYNDFCVLLKNFNC